MRTLQGPIAIHARSRRQISTSVGAGSDARLLVSAMVHSRTADWALALASVVLLCACLLIPGAPLTIGLCGVAIGTLAAYRALTCGNYLLALVGAYVTATLAFGLATQTVGAPPTRSDPNLYSPALVAEALVALSAGVAVFVFSSSVFTPTIRPTWPLEVVPDNWVWWTLTLGVSLQALNDRGESITSLPYPFNNGAILSPGLEALGVVLSIHSLFMAHSAFRTRPRFFWAVVGCVAASIGYYQLFKGGRAAALGLGLAVVVLWHVKSRRALRNVAVVVAMTLIASFTMVWASVRASAPTVGIIESVNAGASQLVTKSDDGRIDQLQLIPQSFEHLLDTVDLYQTGISRNGETYTNLVLQSVPDAIASRLNLPRPDHDADVLRLYRVHGGGFFVPAEAYWNFGLGGLLGMMVIWGVLLGGAERLARSASMLMAAAYTAILSYGVTGISYGTQGFIRIVEISFALWLLGRYVRKRTARHLLVRAEQEAAGRMRGAVSARTVSSAQVS